MALLKGILSGLSGSAGNLTFRRVKGMTVVSEKATNVTNTRTAAQQQHRMKWPNLIKIYKGVSPLLNNAFENKPDNYSDYNAFMKANFAANQVYLTKQEAAADACVAAPYIISSGSIASIELTGEPGESVTDIALGSLTIDDNTTIGEFALAVVSNNIGYSFDEQISFIRVIQRTNAITGYPQCQFVGECVVLKRGSEVKLRSCVSAAGFSVKDGNLACSLGSDFQGAYVWVHSAKASGYTRVSTQIMVMKNDLYADYSGEDAYRRAVATYGGENNSFLTPDSAPTSAVDVPAAGDNSGSESGGGTGSDNSGGGSGSDSGGGSDVEPEF